MKKNADSAIRTNQTRPSLTRRSFEKYELLVTASEEDLTTGKRSRSGVQGKGCYKTVKHMHKHTHTHTRARTHARTHQCAGARSRDFRVPTWPALAPVPRPGSARAGGRRSRQQRAAGVNQIGESCIFNVADRRMSSLVTCRYLGPLATLSSVAGDDRAPPNPSNYLIQFRRLSTSVQRWPPLTRRRRPRRETATETGTDSSPRRAATTTRDGQEGDSDTGDEVDVTQLTLDIDIHSQNQ